MEYKIYQIKDMRNTEYSFCDWEYAERMFKAGDYKEVWSGEIEVEKGKYVLEELYYIFNVEHPAGFKGHSLSVSDVVALKRPGNDYWYYYYCDAVGWKNIDEKFLYKYGMQLRGYSPMAQPKGVVIREDDPEGKYFDIIYYSEPLTEKELCDYELDDLN